MKVKDLTGAAVVADAPGEQWEYLVRVMPLRSADILSALGADGWELVSVTPESGNMAAFYFKRRLR